MNKYRKIAIVIMAISVILTFWLYGSEFSTHNDVKDIANILSEYIFNDDVQASVVKTKIINNHMVVLFTDERFENFIGLAVFQRGLNLRWRPIRANYGSSITMDHFRFTLGNKDYVFICGVDCDSRIRAYEYVTTDSNPTVIYSNVVSDRNFIDVYDYEIGYWPELRLIDSYGNDIARELHKIRQETYKNIPSGSVGTAELFMIYVFCFIILSIGYVIARYYWTFISKSDK